MPASRGRRRRRRRRVRRRRRGGAAAAASPDREGGNVPFAEEDEPDASAVTEASGAAARGSADGAPGIIISFQDIKLHYLTSLAEQSAHSSAVRLSAAASCDAALARQTAAAPPWSSSFPSPPPPSELSGSLAPPRAPRRHRRRASAPRRARSALSDHGWEKGGAAERSEAVITRLIRSLTLLHHKNDTCTTKRHESQRNAGAYFLAPAERSLVP